MQLQRPMGELLDRLADLRDGLKTVAGSLSLLVQRLLQWGIQIRAWHAERAGSARLSAFHAALGWLAVTVAFSFLASSAGDRPPAWLAAGIVRIFEVADEITEFVEERLERGWDNSAGTKARPRGEHQGPILLVHGQFDHALRFPPVREGYLLGVRAQAAGGLDHVWPWPAVPALARQFRRSTP